MWADQGVKVCSITVLGYNYQVIALWMQLLYVCNHLAHCYYIAYLCMVICNLDFPLDIQIYIVFIIDVSTRMQIKKRIKIKSSKFAFNLNQACPYVMCSVDYIHSI